MHSGDVILALYLRFNNAQSNQMYVQRIYACRLHFKTPVTVAKSLHLSAPSMPGLNQFGS